MLKPYSMEPLAAWIVLALAALMIGSFLNVVIYRGPAMWGLLDDDAPKRGTLAAPRSYCPHCKEQIPAWRLIPILSFVLQKGRCANCKNTISIRYPLVEATSLVLTIVAVFSFGFTLSALLAAIFGWFLLALAVIDFEIGYLPDWLTLPLLLIGLLAGAASIFITPINSAIGAAAGFAIFTLISIVFKHVRGYEALGGGDAKLLAAIGAWGGWMTLPMVVLAASLSTLAALLVWRLSGKEITATTPIPFGPGLCLAGYGVFLVML